MPPARHSQARLGAALAVAVLLRVLALGLANRHAPEGDESSYLGGALALLSHGEQDVFWPPLTSWLLAGLVELLGPDPRTLRAAWVVLDLVNVALVYGVARAVWARRTPFDVPALAAFLYAIYVPAIAFSCSLTSETPALTLVLVGVRMVLADGRNVALAGVPFGVAALARANLLPIPLALAVAVGRGGQWRRAVALCVLSLLPTLGWSARNASLGQDFVVSANASFNLYLGNGPEYQEDLNLFDPRATPAQRAARHGAARADVAEAKRLSPHQRTVRAFGFIAADPVLFARRSLGRLARIFAPKTAQLSLLGGDNGARAGSPEGRVLLGVTLLEWLLALSAGLVGIAMLLRASPAPAGVLVAWILGALPLGMIAVAKPRYAFPFEPAILVAAAIFAARPREALALPTRYKAVLLGLAAFLVWGWSAWVVFVFTSRS